MLLLVHPQRDHGCDEGADVISPYRDREAAKQMSNLGHPYRDREKRSGEQPRHSVKPSVSINAKMREFTLTDYL